MIARVGERLLLTLWVGSVWSIGYLAVPVLFATLDDRMLAGLLAGKMFAIVAWIGLIAGVVLVLGETMRHGWKRNWRLALLIGMVAVVAIGQFGIQPIMAELKAVGLEPGSSNAAAFARWHGLASLLYMATALGGIALVATPRSN